MSAVSAEGKVSSWVTDSTKAVFRRWYWDREESGEYNRPEFGSGVTGHTHLGLEHAQVEQVEVTGRRGSQRMERAQTRGWGLPLGYRQG